MRCLNFAIIESVWFSPNLLSKVHLIIFCLSFRATLPGFVESFIYYLATQIS